MNISRRGFSPRHAMLHSFHSGVQNRAQTSHGLPRTLSSHSRIQKDPRPLMDRRYVQESARALAGFLNMRGLASNVISKMFANPFKADFENVVLFLVHHIDPTFRFQKNIEDELPSLLKALGYPFPLPKSALGAIGSPHTWPILLGALTWLLGLVQYSDLQEQREKDNIDEQKLYQRDSLILHNTIEAYKRFLDGENIFPDLDQELMRFFTSHNLARQDEIERLESDCQELGKTLHALNSHPSPLELICEYRDSLQHNIDKYLQIVPLLVKYENQTADTLDEIDCQISTEEESIEVLIAEKNYLMLLAAEQEKEGIVAEKIFLRRNSLQGKLQRIRTSCSHVKARLHEEKSRNTASTERLEKSLAAYENTANSVLEFGTAIGCVETLSLSFRRVEGEKDIDCGLQIYTGNVSHIVTSIEQIGNAISEHVRKLQQELFFLREEQDQTEEILILARNEKWMLQSRIQNLKSEYEGMRVIFQSQLDAHRDAVVRREGFKLEMPQECGSCEKISQKPFWSHEREVKLYGEMIRRRRETIKEIASQCIPLTEEYSTNVEECLHILRSQFGADCVLGDQQEKSKGN